MFLFSYFLDYSSLEADIIKKLSLGYLDPKSLKTFKKLSYPISPKKNRKINNVVDDRKSIKANFFAPVISRTVSAPIIAPLVETQLKQKTMTRGISDIISKYTTMTPTKKLPTSPLKSSANKAIDSRASLYLDNSIVSPDIFNSFSANFERNIIEPDLNETNSSISTIVIGTPVSALKKRKSGFDYSVSVNEIDESVSGNEIEIVEFIDLDKSEQLSPILKINDSKKLVTGYIAKTNSVLSNKRGVSKGSVDKSAIFMRNYFSKK